MTNRFQPLFDVQREHFLSGATKYHDRRIDHHPHIHRIRPDNKDAD